MTKKDYQLIADVVRNVTPRVQRKLLYQDFADVLKEDNPRFDASKFKAACGVE
jgi:hypothetical protein